MTESLDTIVVNTLQMGFPGEGLRPTIGAFACNCLVQDAWTTRRQDRYIYSLPGNLAIMVFMIEFVLLHISNFFHFNGSYQY